MIINKKRYINFRFQQRCLTVREDEGALKIELSVIKSIPPPLYFSTVFQQQVLVKPYACTEMRMASSYQNADNLEYICDEMYKIFDHHKRRKNEQESEMCTSQNMYPYYQNPNLKGYGID